MKSVLFPKWRPVETVTRQDCGLNTMLKKSLDETEEKLLCQHPSCRCAATQSNEFCCEVCASEGENAEACRCRHVNCENEEELSQ